MSSMTVEEMMNYLQTLVDEKGEKVKDYQIYIDIISNGHDVFSPINGIRIRDRWEEVILMN